MSALCPCRYVGAGADDDVHEEYYVVRDSATKRCTVVDQKPTVTATIVDNGFFGMKTMVVCTTEEHEHED